LTDDGVTLAWQIASARRGGATCTMPRPAGGERPEWGPTLRELRYRGRLVKRFRRAAPNQEGVLNTFEELGWPARVDDPLPPERGTDPAERLRETVKSLNRGQQGPLLLFRIEPDQRGVRWAALEEGALVLPASPPISL
jgi:hypothetical protein